MVGNWFNVWMVSSFLKEKSNNFPFVGKLKELTPEVMGMFQMKLSDTPQNH